MGQINCWSSYGHEKMNKNSTSLERPTAIRKMNKNLPSSVVNYLRNGHSKQFSTKKNLKPREIISSISAFSL